MVHIGMSHGAHRNESYYIYQSVMAHIGISHGTHENETQMYTSHITKMRGVGPDTQVNAKYYTYVWVVSHTYKTRSEYYLIHFCVFYCTRAISRIYVGPDTHVKAKYHTCECVFSLMRVLCMCDACLECLMHVGCAFMCD